MAQSIKETAWGPEHMPDMSGRTIVVTGANGGLGYEAARQFAHRGGHVILACRDQEKAEYALQTIRSERTDVSIEYLTLDLASLESIRSFAKRCLDRHSRIHVLCNNAGVMAIPQRQTVDGFEMQLGTNHLGHFALTGQLLPALLNSAGARVVNVSSTAHRIGRMDFEDLNWELRYGRWAAYGRSKLANLLFTYELQRRFSANGTDLISVACHPGYAATNLQFVAAQMEHSSLRQRVMEWGNRVFAQSAAMGALPTLYAATCEKVTGGDFIGPNRLGETRGHPTTVRSSARSYDRGSASELWRHSERLTGIRYEALSDAGLDSAQKAY